MPVKYKEEYGAFIFFVIGSVLLLVGFLKLIGLLCIVTAIVLRIRFVRQLKRNARMKNQDPEDHLLDEDNL